MKRVRGRTVCMISLFGVWAIPSLFSGQNVESSVGWDGGGRWRAHGIVRYGEWSLGISALLFSESGGRLMIGVNSPWITLGHLSDAGLAAEVRNPGYNALSRLTERTVYRADLRSNTASRFGMAIHRSDGRYGVGWEKRNSGEYAIIWARPPMADNWSVELFTEGGIRRSSGGDEAWYPKIHGDPGGPMGIAAIRLQNTPGSWVWGITAVGSGGASYRPGGLLAGAMMFARGPWRFRIRATWGSDFFRSADGKKVSTSRGMGADVLFRPGWGLRGTLGYRTPYSAPPGTRMESDKANIALGWNSDPWQVRFDAVLNSVFFNPPGNTGEFLSSLGTELQVNGEKVKIRARWAWKFPGDQSIRLEGRLRLGRRWSWNLVWKAHWADSAILWSLRVGSELVLSRHRLSLVVFFGDIPRDWIGGPSGSNDCDVRLTWRMRYGD